jgi:hypothetical protein
MVGILAVVCGRSLRVGRLEILKQFFDPAERLFDLFNLRVGFPFEASFDEERREGCGEQSEQADTQDLTPAPIARPTAVTGKRSP